MKLRIQTQLRALRPTMTAIYVPAMAMLLASVVVSVRGEIPISHFTRDPAALTEAHPFLGIVSVTGNLLWCACAAICFFSYAVLRARGRRGEESTFLLFSGLVTTILLVDDLFLLHEEVVPRYLGVDEIYTFGAYALMGVLYLLRFRSSILRVDFVLLVLACVFFGASLVIDFFPRNTFPMHDLIEDGPKLLGIASWLGFFGRAGMRALTVERPDIQPLTVPERAA